jgi:hypothetical protein
MEPENGSIRDMLRMVFMPLAFIDKEAHEQMKADEVDMFYEYVSEAGPRSVNGMPIFMSVQTLTRTESLKCWGFLEQYRKLKEEFHGNEKESGNQEG